MAEPARVPDNEVDQVREDREERQNEKHTPSELPNTESPAELNLLVVYLSLFSSLNSEQSLNLAKNEQERHKNGAKASIKRLQNSRREMDEANPVRRRTTQRFNTTVRDSRLVSQQILDRFRTLAPLWAISYNKPSKIMFFFIRNLIELHLCDVQARSKNVKNNVIVGGNRLQDCERCCTLVQNFQISLHFYIQFSSFLCITDNKSKKANTNTIMIFVLLIIQQIHYADVMSL